MTSKNYFKLLPLAAFAYEPKDDELVIDLLGAPIRRIFLCNEKKFSEFERAILKEEYDYIKEQGLVIPKYYTKEDALRQIQGNDYDIDKSFKNIKHEIEWKAANLPVQLTDDMTKILNCGFMYFHGRDNRYRPLIFFNPGKYDNKAFPIETWQKAVNFFIDYMINNTLIPGKVENWNIIVDCGDLKIAKIPYDLKKIFSDLKGVYRCRLFKLYLLNLTGILMFAWKIAVSLIGPTVEAKATMVEKEDGKYTKLFQIINRSQVEEKYGGKAPNLKEGEIFPTQFFVNEYSTEEEIAAGNTLKGCQLDHMEYEDEVFFEAKPLN